jgi:hypothetical protein
VKGLNGSHHKRRSIISLTLTTFAVALSIGAWREAYVCCVSAIFTREASSISYIRNT